MLGHLVIAPLFGKNLYNTETFGKADPYVVVTLGAHTGKTEVHQNAGTNPKWSSKFTFPVLTMSDTVHFAVFDKESIGSDELMGEGTFSVSQLSSMKHWVGDVQLMRKSKPAGSVQVDMEFIKN